MHGVPLSRRELLASGVAAGISAVSGCLGFGNDTTTDHSETELSLSLTKVDGSLRNRYVHDRKDPDDSWDEQALTAALSDDQYTTQLRKPFFASADDPAYVVHEGTYYQLNELIVDEVTVTHPVLRLFEAEDVTGTAIDGSEDGDLPRADQRAVNMAHFAARARGNEGGFPAGLVQRGGYAYRSETSRNESDILTEDGPEYVTFRDTIYEVEITHEQFFEPVYQPIAEPVAESPERMEAILRATFVGARVSQVDLSPEAQRIISQASADDYNEIHPFSDAFEELLRALDKRAYIDGNIRKDAGARANEKEMIQYEQTYYDHLLRIADVQVE